MKLCRRCQTDKPASQFYRKNNTCKECKREMAREYRARNIARYKAYESERDEDLKSTRFLGPDVW